MRTLNYELLEQLMKKEGYVPPPQPQQQMPVDQMGSQPPGPSSPEELMQVIQNGLSQGVPPQEIANVLQQQGIPPEVINEALNAATQQQEAPPQQPSININEEAEKAYKAEKQRAMMTPDDRLGIMEKKVELLTKIVQDMIGGMPPKQADYRDRIDGYFEALEYV